MHAVSILKLSYKNLASFPDLAQLSVACSTASNRKLGGAWVRQVMESWVGPGNKANKNQLIGIHFFVPDIIYLWVYPLVTLADSSECKQT